RRGPRPGPRPTWARGLAGRRGRGAGLPVNPGRRPRPHTREGKSSEAADSAAFSSWRFLIGAALARPRSGEVFEIALVRFGLAHPLSTQLTIRKTSAPPAPSANIAATS